MFSDQIEHFVPPKRNWTGSSYFKDLFYIRPRSKKQESGCLRSYTEGNKEKGACLYIW